MIRRYIIRRNNHACDERIRRIVDPAKVGRPGKGSLRRREQLICPALGFRKFIAFDRRRLVLGAAQSFVGPCVGSSAAGCRRPSWPTRMPEASSASAGRMA